MYIRATEQIDSNISEQKLQKMAEILADNTPDLSEGWDEIRISGDRVREHEEQDYEFDDR